MLRSKIITHQGREILYQDFSGLRTADEVNAVITESRKYFHSQPLGTAMSLANIEEMHFNNQIKDLFMNFVKENKPYMKASAIIGVTGLKQIVFNGIMKLTGRDVKSFNNEDQAKKWLISQN
jgi:hypothetical protein